MTVEHPFLPEPIKNLFSTNQERHNYNTRQQNDPIIINRNLAILDKSFLCKAPLLWSALGQQIKSCATISSFAHNIKKSKIRLY